jgi:hypothetical protein
VRGVHELEVLAMRGEVIVRRTSEEASPDVLVEAVLTVGYEAYVIPLRAVRLAVSGIDCDEDVACCRDALRKVRGVRCVFIADGGKIRVLCDVRLRDEALLVAAAKAAGFEPAA